VKKSDDEEWRAAASVLLAFLAFGALFLGVVGFSTDVVDYRAAAFLCAGSLVFARWSGIEWATWRANSRR
jgi:hypothetical protein